MRCGSRHFRYYSALSACCESWLQMHIRRRKKLRYRLACVIKTAKCFTRHCSDVSKVTAASFTNLRLQLTLRELWKLELRVTFSAHSVLPLTWNALPYNTRTVADTAKFRKLLKSHYSSAVFNICWLLLAPVLLIVIMHICSSKSSCYT